MKKLIMAMAVMAIAGMTQAASVSWSLSLGKSPYGGYSAYGFIGDSAAAAAMSSALTTTGIGALTGYAWNGTLSTARGSATALIIDDNLTDSSTIYFVVLSEAAAGGSVYVTDALAVSGYTYSTGGTPPATLPKSTADAFTNVGTIAASTPTPGPEDVPEPTSGLLMLFGAAGLALRRKRA